MKIATAIVKKWLKHWYETNAGDAHCREFSTPEAREEERIVRLYILDHLFPRKSPTKTGKSKFKGE